MRPSSVSRAVTLERKTNEQIEFDPAAGTELVSGSRPL